MKNLIKAIAFITLCSSCETVVTDDLDIPNTQPLLVVEGGVERFDDGAYTRTEVYLSTTIPYLSKSDVSTVEDARVWIEANGQIYPLTHVADGRYSSNLLVGSVNTSYTLQIEWKSFTYSATDVLNQVPTIDSIYSVFQEETGITDEGYFLQLNTRDPSGIPNYYHYRVYRNGEYVMLPDPGNARTLVVSDEFFDGAFLQGVNPNEEAVFEPGDIGRAEQMSISKAYYQFLFSFYELTGNQGLSFTGNPPPASIRGNVLAGSENYPRALGFFHAADVATAEVVVLP